MKNTQIHPLLDLYIKEWKESSVAKQQAINERYRAEWKHLYLTGHDVSAYHSFLQFQDQIEYTNFTPKKLFKIL